jgi:hypothetical protein
MSKTALSPHTSSNNSPISNLSNYTIPKTLAPRFSTPEFKYGEYDEETVQAGDTYIVTLVDSVIAINFLSNN